MLRGTERFYDEWRVLVGSVISHGPVLDLGTPFPFRKEMSVFREEAGEPYFSLDVTSSPSLDTVGAGEALPFCDASIGGVLCSHVLEHVVDPGQVVREIRRVLVPGGRAYVTLLVVHPYHGAPGWYRDNYRFTPDAVDVLFEDWTEVDVVVGGGPVQVALAYLPNRVTELGGQWLANRLDPHWRGSLTPVLYVSAEK